MSHWRSDEGWTYDLFDLDTDADIFGPHASFVSNWQSFRQDNIYPSWKDIDLMSFPDWYGRLSVFNILAVRPLKIEYRFWGTKLTEIWQQERTGRIVEEGEEGFNPTDSEFFEQILRSKKIGQWEGMFYWQNRKHINVSIVTAPLGEPGKPADKTISAYLTTE